MATCLHLVTFATSLHLLREEIASAFERMVNSGMRRFVAAEHAPLLLSTEVCYLRHEGALSLPDDSDTQCKSLIQNWRRPERQKCAGTFDHERTCSCWPTTTHSLIPRCTAVSTVGHRPHLYSFYPAATAPPNASHLREAVANDGTMLFMGDSLMDEISRAARCELRRAGLDDKRVVFQRSDPSGAHSMQGMQSAFRAAGGPKGRVVVAFSMGVHYNDGAHLNRTAMQAHAAKVLRLLESFAVSCPRCTVALITTHSQHFTTPDGCFRGPGSRRLPGTSQRPVGEGAESWVFIPANVSARTPDLFGCRAWTEQPRPDSCNAWRAEELMAACAAHAPHVHIVPLHRVSSLWWSAHVGMNLERHAKLMGGNPWKTTYDRYEMPDCTHFCPSPFLYQPVWWALARALTAHDGHEKSELNGSAGER